MRRPIGIRPFRLPRPVLRLVNTDSQLIWLIVVLWAVASALAIAWIFADA